MCNVFLHIVRDTKIITPESFLSTLYARFVIKAMFNGTTKAQLSYRCAYVII